jgi:hypothetical protein
MDAKRKGTSDPDAPASAEEVAAADALREALASSSTNEAAEFARALSLSHDPRPIDGTEHRALVEGAIARIDARRARARSVRARAAIVGVTGSLALAAAIALVVGRASLDAESAPSSSSLEPLVPARSTQPLFREPFARTGGESARIDRIASARTADLRDNRFAAWGVR